MERNENWLCEMIEAALDEPNPNVVDPDFRTIADRANTSPAQLHQRALRLRKILIPLAAAAALFLGTASLVRYGSRLETRRQVRKETELFVEQLIGDSLFDEGLEITEPWVLDLIDGDFLFETNEI